MQEGVKGNDKKKAQGWERALVIALKSTAYTIHKTKNKYELQKRNKKYRKYVSNLLFVKLVLIYVLGGMNYGKSYHKNRKYNN